MISHKHKCIFIHIPKVAGSSIEKIIWPNEADASNLWMGFVDDYHNKYQTGGLQHLLARYVREEIGEKIFNEYYKFSFVRNPWDKAVSQYCYMKKRPDLKEFIGMKDNDCFKRYLELIALKEHVQWLPQTRFLRDLNGDTLVDYVGRFEILSADAKEVFNRLDLKKMKLPHVNKSKKRHYRHFYDTESIEMVADFYADDIQEFGYGFL
ncbi:MAG: sulfotransferase family 2 domain-containing protein [Candidatus Saccharimonadales bacterium]